MEKLEEEKKDTGPEPSVSMILQLFAIPLIIVVVAVGIVALFGLIAREGRTTEDLLEAIRRGGETKRWEAAFQLAKLFQALGERDQDVSKLIRPEDSAALIRLFEQSEPGGQAGATDPRLRRYLATVLAYVKDDRATAALVKALDDGDEDTCIYAIWALGMIADDSAIPALLDAARDEDPDIREVAVYSLGSFAGDEVGPVLRGALNDSTPAVRWNAALALGKRGEAEGLGVIEKMLSREHLDQFAEFISERQKEEVMINALKALAVLERHSALTDDSIREKVEDLSQNDRSIKVRSEAFNTLRAFREDVSVRIAAVPAVQRG